MLQQKRHCWYSNLPQANNFIARRIKHSIKIKILVLFIQCIFLIKSVLGLLGSGFLK